MTISEEELIIRFSYHAPGSDKIEKHQQVRGLCYTLASTLNDLVPDCREKDEAFSRLDEIMMWANAALARRESGN